MPRSADAESDIVRWSASRRLRLTEMLAHVTTVRLYAAHAPSRRVFMVLTTSFRPSFHPRETIILVYYFIIDLFPQVHSRIIGASRLLARSLERGRLSKQKYLPR